MRRDAKVHDSIGWQVLPVSEAGGVVVTLGGQVDQSSGPSHSQSWSTWKEGGVAVD